MLIAHSGGFSLFELVVFIISVAIIYAYAANRFAHHNYIQSKMYGDEEEDIRLTSKQSGEALKKNKVKRNEEENESESE